MPDWGEIGLANLDWLRASERGKTRCVVVVVE